MVLELYATPVRPLDLASAAGESLHDALRVRVTGPDEPRVGAATHSNMTLLCALMPSDA